MITPESDKQISDVMDSNAYEFMSMNTEDMKKLAEDLRHIGDLDDIR